MRPKAIISYLAVATLVVACGKSGEPKVAAVALATPAPSVPIAPMPDVGKIETVTVTTKGSGPSAGVAVQEAMKMAILEVNGATIDSSSVAVKFGLDVTEGQTSAMLRGAAFAEAIAQRSKGAISGLKLLDLTEPTTQGGLYKVTIEAAIARFRPPEDSEKIKIAIAPLRANINAFVFGTQSIPAAKIAQDIHQQIVDALTATGRFNVLDRDFGSDVQQELDLVSTGQTPNSEMAKLSQTLSADVVWVGTINDFAYVRTARKLVTSDRELVSYSGGWSVSQRILKVSTRQIMLSTTLKELALTTDPTTMDRGINVEQTASSMESAIVSEAVAAILSRTFPVTVLAKNGTNVVLSQGGQSVKEGVRYAVASLGKEMFDPQTQQSLGRIETPCCDVVIDKVAATMSYGHLENVKMALDSVDPTGLQIREELKPAKVAAAEKPEADPKVKPVSLTLGTDVGDVPAPASDESKKW